MTDQCTIKKGKSAAALDDIHLPIVSSFTGAAITAVIRSR